jgi:hypothetical protein
MPPPTYWTEVSPDGEVTYRCLVCAEQSLEHHSADWALFEQHMVQRHSGALIEAPAAANLLQEDEGKPDEAPAGAEPPSQEPPPPEPEPVPSSAEPGA